VSWAFHQFRSVGGEIFSNVHSSRLLSNAIQSFFVIIAPRIGNLLAKVLPTFQFSKTLRCCSNMGLATKTSSSNELCERATTSAAL
jgi:hypothetical protein